MSHARSLSALDLRQACQDFVLHAGSEVGILFVIAQIFEGQHGYAFVGMTTRCGGAGGRRDRMPRCAEGKNAITRQAALAMKTVRRSGDGWGCDRSPRLRKDVCMVASGGCYRLWVLLISRVLTSAPKRNPSGSVTMKRWEPGPLPKTRRKVEMFGQVVFFDPTSGQTASMS